MSLAVTQIPGKILPAEKNSKEEEEEGEEEIEEM